MTVEIVTDFRHLCKLAREIVRAKASGDPERIKKAIKEHDDYKELCLKADKMNIGVRREIL